MTDIRTSGRGSKRRPGLPDASDHTLAAEFDDGTVKHLEFIQGVISRLANDSFLMKGWALTVGAAFFGFSAKDVDWKVAAVGLVPILAFWGLDGYFLSRERIYRELYEAVRRRDDRIQPFSMDYRLIRDSKTWHTGKPENGRWWIAAWAGPIRYFYLPVFAVGFALVLVTSHLL